MFLCATFPPDIPADGYVAKMKENGLSYENGDLTIKVPRLTYPLRDRERSLIIPPPFHPALDPRPLLV